MSVTLGKTRTEEVRAAWLAGLSAAGICMVTGIGAGRLGELVVQLGLPLRDHRLRLIDKVATEEDLRIE